MAGLLLVPTPPIPAPSTWPLPLLDTVSVLPPPFLLQVTVIDQSDRFVFKPLLYELLSGAASEEEVAPPFAQLLGPYPVTFLQGRVASVQPENATQVRGSRGLRFAHSWIQLGWFAGSGQG